MTTVRPTTATPPGPSVAQPCDREPTHAVCFAPAPGIRPHPSPPRGLAVGCARFLRAFGRCGTDAAATGMTAADLRRWLRRLVRPEDAPLRAFIEAMLADWKRASAGTSRVDARRAIDWFARVTAERGGVGGPIGRLEGHFERLGLLRAEGEGLRTVDLADLMRLLATPSLASHPAAAWLGRRLQRGGACG